MSEISIDVPEKWLGFKSFFVSKLNMPLMNLLKKVRVDGRFKIDRSLSLENSLPIVIGEDESGSDVPYMNSGGRSIIFEYGGSAYRLKGVDPNGILTQKVATSGKNKILDVELFYFARKRGKVPHRLTVSGKPFGILSEEDAMREISVLEVLNEAYSRMGVPPPYEHARTHRFEDGNVQNLYEIPSLDSDLRLEEFDHLMKDRLNRCSLKKLENKSNNIFKLYSRFLVWEGWNLGLLARNKLEPSPNSWVPQNFVISKYENGYGIFRVDHTSTRRNEECGYEELIDKILNQSGLQTTTSDTFGSYTHIPTSVLIALNFRLATGKKPKRKKPLFEQAYIYRGPVRSWERGYGYYLTIYGVAFVSGSKSRLAPEPIPEKMIRKAFM